MSEDTPNAWGNNSPWDDPQRDEFERLIDVTTTDTRECLSVAIPEVIWQCIADALPDHDDREQIADIIYDALISQAKILWEDN